MNINFLPQTSDISWIKTAWTLLSIQARFSLASFKVLEIEVTGLSRAAVTYVSKLGFIKILCSTTEDSKIFPFQQMSHWVYLL